ncbi:MAG: CvpA family protein [Bacteroidaceae bacterium]|nr:CvpA family protein [Bacteroidales bacterium]MBP3409288.1 CvpA family protein [Bacteroidaceae bacterium]
MNTIDIIYIIATAGALIGGFMTGFLSKVSSIVGIVFGIFNAIVLQESASKMLQDATELSETNATIIAFAALLIVSFIAVKIVAAILAWILDVLHLGIINKLAGALLSGIVTLVIVTAIIDVTSLLAPENRYTGKTVQQGSMFYNKIANDVYKDVVTRLF